VTTQVRDALCSDDLDGTRICICDSMKGPPIEPCPGLTHCEKALGPSALRLDYTSALESLQLPAGSRVTAEVMERAFIMRLGWHPRMQEDASDESSVDSRIMSGFLSEDESSGEEDASEYDNDESEEDAPRKRRRTAAASAEAAAAMGRPGPRKKANRRSVYHPDASGKYVKVAAVLILGGREKVVPLGLGRSRKYQPGIPSRVIKASSAGPVLYENLYTQLPRPQLWRLRLKPRAGKVMRLLDETAMCSHTRVHSLVWATDKEKTATPRARKVLPQHGLLQSRLVYHYRASRVLDI
jgi:hypothetical protein